MSDLNRDMRLVSATVALSIAITLCCGCAGLIRAGLDRSGGDVAEEIRPVRTLTVTESGGAETRSFTGTARAGEEARLSFKVAGSVQTVHVKVGDRVGPGAPIAQLDPIDLQLQVQSYGAALVQAEAQARNFRATYDRVRGLYVQDNASHADLDSARASADSADAMVASARNQRALASQQLHYASLTASREGAIVEVLVNAGENVAAGQPVVTLASGSRPEVVIGVPASLIGRVTEGQPAVATFAELADEAWAVVVTEVGVATSASTTFPVTVRLEEETDQVRPGMSAEVTLGFASTEQRMHIRVPSVAVAEDRLGQHLWVVEPGKDGLANVRRRAVVLGELTSEGIDVVEGLRDGDRVVTAGVSRIHDGQTVRMTEEPAP